MALLQLGRPTRTRLRLSPLHLHSEADSAALVAEVTSSSVVDAVAAGLTMTATYFEEIVHRRRLLRAGREMRETSHVTHESRNDETTGALTDATMSGVLSGLTANAILIARDEIHHSRAWRIELQTTHLRVARLTRRQRHMLTQIVWRY